MSDKLNHPDVEKAEKRELYLELLSALLIFIFMLVCTVFMQQCSNSAAAQDDSPVASDDAVTLARLCVHEAGWDSPADCALIHAVLMGIVERDGVTYEQAAELAAPRLARCMVSRRWVCGLDEDAARPAYWPLASWETHRPQWLDILDHAQRVISGEVESPCSSTPRVWGSAADVARGRGRGFTWVDAGCRGTRNLGGRWR